MDTSACTDLAFGQSNLRNQGLLETTLPWGSHTIRGSHDFSLFFAGYVGVSHKISQGKCKSQFCSLGKCPYLAEGHNRASKQTTKKCSNPVPDSALLGPAGRERHAAQEQTQLSQGQMLIPIMQLTCRSQLSALIVMQELLPLQFSSSLSPTCTRTQAQHLFPSPPSGISSSCSPPCPQPQQLHTRCKCSW